MRNDEWFILSLIVSLITSYYVTWVYILIFIKNKNIDMINFTKNIQ